ncbi:TonB-dependent receptor [Aquincola tertiaricarbonis]|uniref:TonB-dependent receptor n=1 Tax=Aquincola tertiaricarbonis TaxID=391953 RepID=UPI0018DC5B78|nr:TonB-dependent receptor [Aquincola tertiaricarbonis]
MKKTASSTAVVGFCLLAAGVASAQPTQRVEITGSAIKRLDAEGPAPVDVFTRKDIARTGATTVSELVKSISALEIDDQGEMTQGSPSGSGASNLQMRGLSERNILILLNGRRLPVAAIQDGSGSGAAVDVNNIPLSAIERVEILKDGGSAIYGADAVAGVINFITKKNYTGIEARAGIGQSTHGDATEKTGGLTFGLGNYDEGGFNLLAAVDVLKRDPLPRAARRLTRSADFRNVAGPDALDGRSTFHPVGNIVSGPGAPGQVRDCPPEDLKGGLCRFDYSRSILNSINGADRVSALLIGNLKLGTSTRAFTEVMLSRSDDTFKSQPAPFAYTDSEGTTYRHRAMQFGPRTTDRHSTLTNLVLGFEGSHFGIDWDIAAGQGTNKTSNNDRNFAAVDKTYAALDDGTFDPTVTTNPQSIIDALSLRPTRTGKSVLKFFNAKGSGQLAELPGGPLGYAVGVSFNQESLTDIPDDDQIGNNVLGSIAQAPVNAKRSSQAIFGELSIPIFTGLEAQLAVRHDRFTDVSAVVDGERQSFSGYSKTSPKVALRYQPSKQFMARASYAGSFLPPSLKQQFGGVDQGANSTSDALICNAFPTLSGNCDSFPYQQITGSNPGLKPEVGKTWNLGFVIEPIPQFSAGIDFFWIKKRDEISQPTVETAVVNGAVAISTAGEAQVFTNNLNLASTKVRGYDLQVQARALKTPLGRLSIKNTLTYYNQLEQQLSGEPSAEYVGTFLKPRWRNTLSATLENDTWSATATVRTTDSMRDTDQPWGSFDSTETRKISGHEELDLMFQYTGVKSLTLTTGVRNLLNQMPPYSDMGASNQYGSIGFPWMYSPRGRYVFVSANYAFR